MSRNQTPALLLILTVACFGSSESKSDRVVSHEQGDTLVFDDWKVWREFDALTDSLKTAELTSKAESSGLYTWMGGRLAFYCSPEKRTLFDTTVASQGGFFNISVDKRVTARESAWLDAAFRYRIDELVASPVFEISTLTAPTNTDTPAFSQGNEYVAANALRADTMEWQQMFWDMYDGETRIRIRWGTEDLEFSLYGFKEAADEFNKDCGVLFGR